MSEKLINYVSFYKSAECFMISLMARFYPLSAACSSTSRPQAAKKDIKSDVLIVSFLPLLCSLHRSRASLASLWEVSWRPSVDVRPI